MTAPVPTGSTAHHREPRTRNFALRRLAATTAFVAAVMVGTPVAPLYAHSELESSTPAHNAQLAKPPGDIELVFNQEISPRFANISVSLQDDEPRPLDFAVDGRRVVAAVPADLSIAPAGSRSVPWQVAYRVVSADGHPITGTIRFRAPRTTESPASGEALVSPSPAPTDSAETMNPDVTSRSDDHNPASTSESSGDYEDSPILATLVIGGLTAAVALGAAGWLARGRKRGGAE